MKTPQFVCGILCAAGVLWTGTVALAGVRLIEEEGSILGDSAPWRKQNKGSASVLESWMVEVEMGYQWKVGGDTTLDYSFYAGSVSVKSPVLMRHSFADGNHLVVRSQFSLLGDIFEEGPESRYLAFSAAPSLEYWTSDLKSSLFFSLGGGFGFIDSTDVPGGQGQDLTFNWFAKAGVRQRVWEDAYLSAGVMFQHLSNTGLTDPNPGLNTLGPFVGLSFRF